MGIDFFGIVGAGEVLELELDDDAFVTGSLDTMSLSVFFGADGKGERFELELPIRSLFSSSDEEDTGLMRLFAWSLLSWSRHNCCFCGVHTTPRAWKSR